MQGFTVKKFSELCGFSDASYVRQLINQGKIDASKPDGRSWVIDMDSHKTRSYLNEHRKTTDETPAQNTQNTPASTVENTEENTQKILQLTEKLEKYAFEAGQYKQLSDNLKEKEHDVSYWKEEYFKLRSQYEALLVANTKMDEEIKILKPKINNLQKELEAERKRPFWKRNVL